MSKNSLIDGASNTTTRVLQKKIAAIERAKRMFMHLLIYRRSFGSFLHKVLEMWHSAVISMKIQFTKLGLFPLFLRLSMFTVFFLLLSDFSILFFFRVAILFCNIFFKSCVTNNWKTARKAYNICWWILI